MTHPPASRPTLALAPGTARPVPGAGANLGPNQVLPSNITRRQVFATDTALTRAGDGYFTWLDHIWPAAGCAHPIRLAGELATVDTRTGEVLGSVSTSAMPDGVIYKACGNRRTSVCPSCAETYRRDAFHLLHAGLVGGKSVPVSVAEHPAVFATFTAPSFGPVHTRHVKRHVCTDRSRCACKAAPCHARRDMPVCPHGRSLACFARHDSGDARLGQPLCPDCYDHAHHVVWNHAAGELWRRTKQAIERYLNQAARRRGLGRVRVSHGKAAEFQARGVVHFHALLRLDGVDLGDPDALVPPPVGLTAADLDDAVRHAAASIGFRTVPHPARPGGWPIMWGDQLDVRPITLTGDGSVTDTMVAGYLAKYSTKGTEATGHTSRRLDAATIRRYANPTGSHTERLIHAAWTLGEYDDYAGLRRWAHMLGFGGHFLTKARRYSLTFTALRAARATYRRTQDPGPTYAPDGFDRQDDLDTETTLIVGRLSYVGAGWDTTGDALLANTAADQARKRAAVGREELACLTAA